MVKNFNHRFYPNPFRRQGVKRIPDHYEIIEDARELLEPFFLDPLYNMDDYIGGVDNFKPEMRIIRIIREKVKEKLSDTIIHVRNRGGITKLVRLILTPIRKRVNRRIEETNNFSEYQKHLRYLEIPCQPLVNNRGIEIQSTTQDIYKYALDEIYVGYQYLTELLPTSKTFPDPIAEWEDFILFEPDQYELIAHDEILDDAFVVIEQIADDLNKQPRINLYNWAISGDLDNSVLSVLKPLFYVTKLQYTYPFLKSLAILAFTLVVTRKVIVFIWRTAQWIVEENAQYAPLHLKIKARDNYTRFILDCYDRKVAFERPIKRLSLQIKRFRFDNKIKYNLLRFLINTNL